MVEKVTTLKDGSVRMTFDSQELNGKDAAILFSLRRQLGWLLFSENQIKEEDVPYKAAKGVNNKTPSQRLRSIIYVKWSQLKDKEDDFEDYYNSFMESLIEEIKLTLDPEEW